MYVLKNRISYLILSTFLLLACSPRISPSNALIGKWRVMEQYHTTGERVENGIINDKTSHQKGYSGYFNISETDINYKFLVNSVSFEDATGYKFRMEKINSGFSRIPRYSLDLNKGFDFICKFGNETKNSHSNASEIRLIYETTKVGYYEKNDLFLVKS